MKINGVPVSAVVDTAAEITIIAQWAYDKVSPRPNINVNLAGSGVTMTMGSRWNTLIEIGGPS